MKPFRGKPEKPKRSNGEIHRQRRLLPCGFAMLRDFGSATRCHCGMSSVVGVHFSPSRTSRPVGCRPTARTVDCRVAFTRVHVADLWCSRPTARRYGTLQLVSSRTLRAFWLLGRLVPLGFTDLEPLPGARCGRLAGDVLERALSKGYRSATLLLWVLSGPVLKHGPRSLTCARVIGIFSNET